MLLLSLFLASSQPARAADVPLVFIHGIKGSRLVDSRGNTRWLSGWQALGLSSPELGLPLAWEGDAQKTDGVTAAGILDRVVVVPWIAEQKIYSPWLRAARGLAPLLEFSYDWRRDNLENVQRFETFLRGIGRPARVVAHSMGGLVTLALLNRHPELFSSVVFAGVPFKGGIGFLPDLHSGTANGLNRRILSQEILASFPSVYCLFPERSDSLMTSNGWPLPTEFFKATQWQERRIGQFRAGHVAETKFVGFFQKALDRAHAFRRELVAKDIKYPPILVVNGRSFPTLSQAIENGPKSVAGWDFESAPKVPGDGRVQETHSTPPAPIPFELFQSTAEHSELLSDPAVIERIRRFPS